MGNLKDEIKKEIKEEVADIIYEKAKAEVKAKVKKKYYSIKDRILKFFGIGETQEQKIRKISKEIQKKKDPLLDDSALGVIELFTLNYANSMSEMIGIEVSPKNQKEESKL